MPKLRRATLDGRRAHILQAAERCFAKNGFRSTTIADIKREAAVSTGAVYTYFPNKEAMIRAILVNARDRRRSELESAMAGSIGAVGQALVMFEWTMGIFSERGQHDARINAHLWAESLRSPRTGKLARGALQDATHAVSAVVASRLEAASLERTLDADTAASLLIAIFLGLEVQSAVGMSIDPTEAAKVLATFFADYLPPSVTTGPVAPLTPAPVARRRRKSAAR